MNIRCLIIDDKPLAIDVLVSYVAKVDFLELAGTTTDPLKGLSMIRSGKVELVFLDIQMPELSGLQFMKLAGTSCRFILTTAYANYALDGYEHDVVDYLLKPVSFERFYIAADKARQRILPAGTGQRSDVSAGSTIKQLPYLFVKTEHRLHKVYVNEILYVEGLQNYLVIHTPAEKIMSLQTFRKLETQLPEQNFVRVHKSYMVALQHITSVERSHILIGLTVIPIGETYRQNFFQRLEG